MITLENRETRLVEYEIPVAVGGGQTLPVARVQRASDATTRSASKQVSVVVRQFPTTLTLTARSTKGSVSDPLPDAYAEIPAIKAAILSRRLVKREATTVAADAAKAPAKGKQE